MIITNCDSNQCFKVCKATVRVKEIESEWKKEVERKVFNSNQKFLAQL